MQSKWSPVLRLFILHHAVEQSSTTISDHLELDLDKNEYKIALPPKKLEGILTKNNNAKPFHLLGSRPLLSFASLFHSHPYGLSAWRVPIDVCNPLSEKPRTT